MSEMADDRAPPRNRYERLRASIAAPEKQAKMAAVPAGTALSQDACAAFQKQHCVNYDAGTLLCWVSMLPPEA